MTPNIEFKTKKITICTDFDKDLKLYSLPEKLRLKIVKNKKFEIINFDYNNPMCKEAIIYWGNLIDDKRIKFLKNLKWIHLGSAGYDKIKKKNSIGSIKLTRSKGIMSNSVAESVFNFIFIFLRRFDRCLVLRNKKILNRKKFDIYFDEVKNIKDCSFLVFGYGDISRSFISKLNHFSRKIDIVSESLKDSNINKVNKFYLKKRKKFHYDFVISFLPEKKKYNNFFNLNFFKKMKNDSFFINVGRGSVVNEKDLYISLKKNIILGAGLDVFKNEPLKNTNPLLSLDNCLITPHIAGLFNQYWRLQEKLFLHNLKNFLSNKKLKNVVYL